MRKEGFYWVKLYGEWTVAKFKKDIFMDDYWQVLGRDIDYYDDDFELIDDSEIKRSEAHAPGVYQDSEDSN